MYFPELNRILCLPYFFTFFWCVCWFLFVCSKNIGNFFALYCVLLLTGTEWFIQRMELQFQFQFQLLLWTIWLDGVPTIDKYTQEYREYGKTPKKIHRNQRGEIPKTRMFVLECSLFHVCLPSFTFNERKLIEKGRQIQNISASFPMGKKNGKKNQNIVLTDSGTFKDKKFAFFPFRTKRIPKRFSHQTQSFSHLECLLFFGQQKKRIHKKGNFFDKFISCFGNNQKKKMLEFSRSFASTEFDHNLRGRDASDKVAKKWKSHTSLLFYFMVKKSHDHQCQFQWFSGFRFRCCCCCWLVSVLLLKTFIKKSACFCCFSGVMQ